MQNVAELQKVFERPKSLNDRAFHYCPGCGHGDYWRLGRKVLTLQWKACRRATSVTATTTNPASMPFTTTLNMGADDITRHERFNSRLHRAGRSA